jgi:hypothetical protein
MRVATPGVFQVEVADEENAVFPSAREMLYSFAAWTGDGFGQWVRSIQVAVAIRSCSRRSQQ